MRSKGFNFCMHKLHNMYCNLCNHFTKSDLFSLLLLIFEIYNKKYRWKILLFHSIKT